MRAHLQVGLAIAVANIDEVIRAHPHARPMPAAAREALMGRDWPARDMAPLDRAHRRSAPCRYREDGKCRLSEAQARGDSRIAAAAADRARPRGDRRGAEKLAAEIADYLEILPSRARLFGIIKDEMLAVKTAHATPRRTVILDSDADVERSRT